MSVDEEKKFVMKHIFTDVKNTENDTDLYGKEAKHFGIPWKMFLYAEDFSYGVGMHLECSKFKGDINWSIDTTVLVKVFTKDGEKVFENKPVFTHDDEDPYHFLGGLRPVDEFLVDGNLTIEFHVTINKMTGILKRKLTCFDDDSAKEFSDVVLKVKDQKFYVLKKYLALHSTYFKSLFLGNFDESKQSEVELKDIEPKDFQKFLEILYVKPDINDETVSGILKLADMYDSKVVIEQCEKFLVKDSEKNLKEKFFMAVQYKLDNLKKKCISQFKTANDIAAVIPEDSTQFDSELWKELLNLSVDFYNKLAQN